jgi:hypothetical protein
MKHSIVVPASEVSEDSRQLSPVIDSNHIGKGTPLNHFGVVT